MLTSLNVSGTDEAKPQLLDSKNIFISVERYQWVHFHLEIIYRLAFVFFPGEDIVAWLADRFQIDAQGKRRAL